MMTICTLVMNCSKNDDDIEALNKRIAQLEQWRNDNQTALNALIDAQKAGHYVSGIDAIDNGFQITFGNGQVYTIHNGIDGKNGKDGADGKDGDAYFKGMPVIDTKAGTVTFTLINDTVIVLPYIDSYEAASNKLQTLVYIPTTKDGMMTVGDADEAETTIDYAIKPAVVATYMEQHPDYLSFAIEGGLTTRSPSTTARLSIKSVKASINGNEGRIIITAAASGFIATEAYAVALDFSDGTSNYRTIYTNVWVQMANASVSIAASDGVPEGFVLPAGRSLLLVATMKDGDQVRSWTSSNVKVATVTPEGVVVGHSEGEVTITVTTIQGATASFMLKVSSGSVNTNNTGVDQNQANARIR